MLHIKKELLKYTIDHPFCGPYNELDGANGALVIPSCETSRKLMILISDGMGWEHLSVHAIGLNKEPRIPTYFEMCYLKDLFWNDEDTVVQFHPKKSEYVNLHNHTLHLCRCINKEFPMLC